MIVNTALDRIQSGEASAKEARKALRDALAALDDIGSASVYAALRSWTWKALLARRFDDEMETWFRLLRNTATSLSKRDDRHSMYIEALSHLVDESLRYGASNTRELILRRSHIGELLDVVRLNNGRAERSVIEAAMALRSSRLSQVLTELTIAGALNRESDGKHAIFVLTDEGRELLDIWRAIPRVQATAPVLPSAPTPADVPEVRKKSSYPVSLIGELETGDQADRRYSAELNIGKIFDAFRISHETPRKPLGRAYVSLFNADEVANENLPNWTDAYETSGLIPGEQHA